MNGTPLIKVMTWAGHANIATTQRYMHLAPGERDDASAIAALDGLAPTPRLRLVPVQPVG